MKEFKIYINKKIYYMTVFIATFLMIMGFLTARFRLDELSSGNILHAALVILLIGCLLLYPRFESHVFRAVLMIIASAYFYTLFFLYPETWSTFVFLCLIPVFAIFFFDSKLFYYSLFLNGLGIAITFLYISLFKQGEVFEYIEKDIVGNIFNFVGSQAIIFLIFYMMSERIKRQQTYYEQIQHSERLKTTGQLAAAVAHEIRNPLTVVKGFLQIYEKDSAATKEEKKHFSLMIEELDTAEDVITQFLSVAKPNKEIVSERVNVNHILQSVTDLLSSYGYLHDNKIDLQVTDDCYIAANCVELKQLFINLVKNAIEASKLGNSVKITAERKNGLVTIKVIDNGLGMSEDEVALLGTPFYSLKSKGTGLGLMVCYNIVEKYNGTIKFESTKGEGTTVTVSFPGKVGEASLISI